MRILKAIARSRRWQKQAAAPVVVEEHCMVASLRRSWIPAFLWVAVAAAADVGHAGEIAPSQAAAPTLPANEVESFFDGYFEQTLKEYEAPGAVVVFVSDGRIAFAKGYGLANIARNISMDPAETIFPVGSMSKLLTAIAMIQLVEQGNVNLEDDVNRHLDFHIASPFAKPLTIADLLRHSDGLEASYVGIACHKPEHLLSLDKYLRCKQPRVVLPPGEILGYTNEGYTIAGRILERVTGMTFADYMRQHVLHPLEMNRSTFEIPPVPGEQAAIGYGRNSDGDALQALEPFYIHAAPAGGLLSTAVDLGHFMIAQLSDGQFNGLQVVSPQSIRELHARQFSHHPRMLGWTFGFRERIENQERILEHGGVWPGFMMKLMLIPERKQGIFVAYNLYQYKLLDGPGASFVKRFYPAPPAPATVHATRASYEDASRFAGMYQPTVHSRDTFEKLYMLFQQRRVDALADGTLLIEQDNGGPATYEPIEPMLFRRPDEGWRVFFKTDDDGDVKYMLTSSDAYERVPWYGLAWLHRIAFAGFGTIFAIWCVRWIVAVCIARHRNNGDIPRVLNRAELALVLAAAMNAVFLVSLALLLKGIDYRIFTYGVPTVMRALLMIPPLTCVLVLIATIAMLIAWRRGEGSLWRRTVSSAAILSLWTFVPLLLYWNLTPT